MPALRYDPEGFRQAFPCFADPVAYPEARLLAAEKAAAALMDCSDSSPYPYDPERGVYLRETLLHYLICHVLTLDEQGANGQSGVLSAASQGSVSLSFATAAVTDANYFLQTPYGRSYWRMTAPYRVGGRYYAVRHFHPWG